MKQKTICTVSRFWSWARDETASEQRVLRLEGVIAEESWLDDDVTPAAFKAELMAGTGPITVWVNSPGGDCIAAAQIYNMLMDYPNDVTVKIDGIAASAASVIAMAGTKICMSPVSMMMIHNPLTIAMGDSEEMRKAIQLLDEVKESIINSYEIKTGLSRARISHLMNAETWMSAGKALDLGFCDEILFVHPDRDADQAMDSYSFSRCAVNNILLNKLKMKLPQEKPRINVADLEKRLELLNH
jgi:ATP-dependent Clp protease protease subunit